ncbi:hypothetical protein BJ546DRAFT_365927 [Cryomyces antarcticus]
MVGVRSGVPVVPISYLVNLRAIKVSERLDEMPAVFLRYAGVLFCCNEREETELQKARRGCCDIEWVLETVLVDRLSRYDGVKNSRRSFDGSQRTLEGSSQEVGATVDSINRSLFGRVTCPDGSSCVHKKESLEASLPTNKTATTHHHSPTLVPRCHTLFYKPPVRLCVKPWAQRRRYQARVSRGSWQSWRPNSKSSNTRNSRSRSGLRPTPRPWRIRW